MRLMFDTWEFAMSLYYQEQLENFIDGSFKIDGMNNSFPVSATHAKGCAKASRQSTKSFQNIFSHEIDTGTF